MEVQPHIHIQTTKQSRRSKKRSRDGGFRGGVETPNIGRRPESLAPTKHPIVYYVYISVCVCVFVSWWQFGGAFYFRFRYRTISSTRLHRCRRCCRRAFVYCIYVVYCITQNAKQINKRADKVPPTKPTTTYLLCFALS